MIKLNKHNVTNGAHKARVTYSAFRMVSTGQQCVTIYAKDTMNDLHRIFASEYENLTDGQTDYFEKGRVRLLTDHPLYAAALALCPEADQMRAAA
jgi:hypothetical protein